MGKPEVDSEFKQVHISLKKEIKDAFWDFCKQRYTTPSQLIKDFIKKCIGIQ